MSHATPPRPSRSTARDVRAVVDHIARERASALSDRGVTATVRESWERCVRYGLDPDAATPRPARGPLEATRLVDIVGQAIESRAGLIRDSEVCLSLTDADGVILRQWVGNRSIMRDFERSSVVPGFNVSETAIGNTSGSTLVTRQPTLVRGPEHFAPQFSNLTSAGNVITHPITRRVVGTLNLTCRLADTSPMAVAWVCEMVEDIERRMLEASSTAEQLLLKRFLQENRDSRHAVIAVSAQTAMTNVAATKLLGSVDRVQLWSYASASLDDSVDAAPTLTMADGSTLRIHRSAVVGSGDSLGVVLRLTRMAADRPRRAAPAIDLPGLPGTSRRWMSMRQRLALIGEGPALLVGESGVGKRSIARALTPSGAVEVDLSRHDRLLDDVRAAVDAEPATLILVRVDALPPACTSELVAVLDLLPAHVRLLGTSRIAPAAGVIAPGLLDRLPDVVPVPHLQDRADDVPAIVTALTERHTSGSRIVHWMPEAIHALIRREWPENVRSLDRLVKHVLDSTSRDYIGVRDLPAHVVSRAGRRHLIGLERMEADAILQALRETAGNKQHAADALGIARSTLYRKMQALGINAETAV